MEDDAEFSNARQSIETTSDHDEDPSEAWSMSKPGSSLNRRKHGKNKRTITYGKKNHHPSRGAAGRRHDGSTDEESEIEDNRDENPALIRLGEAIILDWNRDALDALFGASDIHGSREYDTRRIAEPIQDLELAAKRQRRATRKKTGVSLDECFTESSKAEILTEGNDWYCNRCKELRLASKKLEIWTAPDILVIHLKRFSANRVFRDKVDVLVDFPVENLDLGCKVGLIEDKDMIYDLIAVDNHYGGLGGGHYTAFAKNFFDGKWYEYNGMINPFPLPATSINNMLTFFLQIRKSPSVPPTLSSLAQPTSSSTVVVLPTLWALATSNNSSNRPGRSQKMAILHLNNLHVKPALRAREKPAASTIRPPVGRRAPSLTEPEPFSGWVQHPWPRDRPGW